MQEGRRIHRVLPKGATARDAKQAESSLRASLGQRRSVAIPGDPLLTDLMDLFIEHADSLRSPDTAKFHAARAGRWLKGYRASQVEEAISAMVEDMRGHYKAATINRSIGTITKALSLAKKRRLIPVNYGASIERLPENNRRDVVLSLDDVQRISDAASEPVKAAIWIALYTGCRRGELCAIEAQDVGERRTRRRNGPAWSQSLRRCDHGYPSCHWRSAWKD
jgi:integrase